MLLGVTCIAVSFQQACGYEFTSKLHRMFTDIGVSKGLTERFHAFAADTDRDLSDVGFNMLVLQVSLRYFTSSLLLFLCRTNLD